MLGCGKWTLHLSILKKVIGVWTFEVEMEVFPISKNARSTPRKIKADTKMGPCPAAGDWHSVPW